MSTTIARVRPKPKVTSLLYSQFLVNSQINYTCDYMAKGNVDLVTSKKAFSGDSVERFLKGNKLTPKLLWDNVKSEIVEDETGIIIFDDTVLDHNSSSQIENVRYQWSGTEHKVIRGIGVVTCVYYNPTIDKFWIIDYRIYDPDRDAKKKTDLVMDMYDLVVLSRRLDQNSSQTLKHRSVHIDAAYSTNKVLAKIDGYGKVYYCNIRSNRLALDLSDDIEEEKKIPKKANYRPVKDLAWNEQNLETGKIIRLNKSPARAIVKLFQVASSHRRTDYLITNDLSTSSSDDIQKENAKRWKVELFHRELKQVTGVEACQCRKQRSQRNHINLCMRVWVFLNRKAQELETTVYQLKKNLLQDYLINEMRNPRLKFSES